MSSDSVILTNALWQKTFVLTGPTVIDLHNLKKIKVENPQELSQKAKVDSPFYAYFSAEKKDFVATVIIRPGKDKIELLTDKASMKDNDKTYSVVVFVKD